MNTRSNSATKMTPDGSRRRAALARLEAAEKKEKEERAKRGNRIWIKSPVMRETNSYFRDRSRRGVVLSDSGAQRVNQKCLARRARRA